MTQLIDPLKRDRRARLRFSIIGALLAAPPAPTELHGALSSLANKVWRDPVSGLDVTFSVSTLERWYYKARRANDPVAALKDRRRGDVGRFPSLAPRVVETLTTQYRTYPGWTAQLHFNNLCAALAGCAVSPPSYSTLRRYLKAQGMFRQATPKRATAGALLARDRLERLEVFGSAANLNIHLHCLFLDGVYHLVDGIPVFRPVPPPTEKQLQILLHQLIQRIMKCLTARDFSPRTTARFT